MNKVTVKLSFSSNNVLVTSVPLLFFAGGAGSLLPPRSGRRHAHPDGGRLGEPRAERSGDHRSGAGPDGAGAGGRQVGGQRSTFLQGEEGHPDVSGGPAERSQRRHPALTLGQQPSPPPPQKGFLVTVLIVFRLKATFLFCMLCFVATAR